MKKKVGNDFWNGTGKRKAVRFDVPPATDSSSSSKSILPTKFPDGRGFFPWNVKKPGWSTGNDGGNSISEIASNK